MAWRRLGDKPLSEPMIVSLLTHTLGLNELTFFHTEVFTNGAPNKMVDNLRTIFPVVFCQNVCLCCLSNFTEVCCQGFSQRYGLRYTNTGLSADKSLPGTMMTTFADTFLLH